MGEPTVAIAMMYGDEATQDNIDRLLASIDFEADHLYAMYTGTQGGTGRVHFNNRKQISVTTWHEDWTKNFGEMRRKLFDGVPREDYDWVMWMDSDDALACREFDTTLKGMLQGLDPDTQVVYLKYVYATNEKGDVRTDTDRERLFRNDVRVYWDGWLHENAYYSPSAQAAYRSDPYVLHDYDARGGGQDKRERNREILKLALRAEPKNSLYKRYFADELYATAFDQVREGGEALMHSMKTYAFALKAYTEFVRENPVATEATYIATHRMAECLRALNQTEEAINTDLQNIKVRPDRPESYIGVAGSLLLQRHYETAISWADRALELPALGPSGEGTAREEVAQLPHAIKAQAYEGMGRLQEAVEEYRIANDIIPRPEIEQHIAALEERMTTQLSNEEKIALRKAVSGTRPERSIAFVTRTLPEAWNRDIIDSKGSGGTEYCVMQIATKFAEDGWRVAIYGSPGDWRGKIEEFDGGGTLEWWSTDPDITPSAYFKYVICLRTPELMDAEWNCERLFLWMHDVNVGEVQADTIWGNRWHKPDNIICVSAWQAQHLTKLYPDMPRDRFIILPNGYDAEMFAGGVDGHERAKFVYTSSPDRGLEVLLHNWQSLKQVIPDATLGIYYGWNFVDKVLEVQPEHPIGEVKQSIINAYEFMNERVGGIEWHDRVSRKMLAEQARSADVWTYPAFFMETHCISAIEMQSLGVLPCTTRLAALKETVVIQNFTILGYPRNVDYMERWIHLLAAMVNAPEDQKIEWRQLGIDFANQFSWSHTYDAWREAFNIVSTAVAV